MTQHDDDGQSDDFARLVGKVKRLHYDGITPHKRKPPAKPRARDDLTPPDPVVDTYMRSSPPPAESFKRGGVQTSVMRKLRRGQFPVTAELDLHGLTASAALDELSYFLSHSQRPRTTCVRIVHGKGLSSPGFKAVLRPRVQHWLREDDRVLAFVPAGRESGGSGATCVLLRARGRD